MQHATCAPRGFQEEGKQILLELSDRNHPSLPFLPSGVQKLEDRNFSIKHKKMGSYCLSARKKKHINLIIVITKWGNTRVDERDTTTHSSWPRKYFYCCILFWENPAYCPFNAALIAVLAEASFFNNVIIWFNNINFDLCLFVRQDVLIIIFTPSSWDTVVFLKRPKTFKFTACKIFLDSWNLEITFSRQDVCKISLYADLCAVLVVVLAQFQIFPSQSSAIKGTVHPKCFNSVIIFSPSRRLKVRWGFVVH